MSCTNSVCKGSYLDQWNVQDNPASMVVNLREEAEKFLRNFYLSHDRLVGKFQRYEMGKMSPSSNVNFILKLGSIQNYLYRCFRSKEFHSRWEHVLHEINSSGTYELSNEELKFGVQTAWRNASRCSARIQWKNLVSTFALFTAGSCWH